MHQFFAVYVPHNLRYDGEQQIRIGTPTDPAGALARFLQLKPADQEVATVCGADELTSFPAIATAEELGELTRYTPQELQRLVEEALPIATD